MDADIGAGGLAGQLQLVGLEAPDLVADAGGLLEFEVGGGVAHALLELGDVAAQIVSDQVDVARHAGVDRVMVALGGRLQDLVDVLLDRGRGDAVRLVVGPLLGAPPVGLGDRVLDRIGHLVGIEDDPAVDVARGAADGLHQRGRRAQKALLVGVEDRHQGAFGDVEALAQQVDADQHVEGAQPEVADDLDALQRVDVGMQVAAADAGLVHVLDEILGHALGQHGDQHALAFLRAVLALGDQVVDLLLDGPDDDRRVDQPGRTDDLLDEDALRALHLPRAGRGADERRLRPQRLPFLELQRPVVDRRGQAETELSQHALAVEVAAEHAADLRHGDVALVDDQQRVLGEVFEQGRRRLAGTAAGEIA